VNYRNLGCTSATVSEITLGCWTMGGLNGVDGQVNSWANVNEDEVPDAITRAVEASVNRFDHADVYSSGRAERILACLLKRLGLKSEHLLVTATRTLSPSLGVLAVGLLLAGLNTRAAAPSFSGELKRWHKATLTREGPQAKELDNDPNLFTDFRMVVAFTHESGSPNCQVPGA
jgi:aryl-alcohol dehydrogenase-like predicted oxidoreductase